MHPNIIEQINNAFISINATNNEVNQLTKIIYGEQLRAVTTEGVLNSTVFAEQVRAATAEGSIATSVSSERARALAAESTEQLRATAVESSLALSVMTERLVSANLQANLTAIIVASQASTAALAAALATSQSSLMQTQSTLRSIVNCTAQGLLPDLSGNCVGTAASGGGGGSSSAQCPSNTVSSNMVFPNCTPGFAPSSSSTSTCGGAGSTYPTTFVCSGAVPLL